MDSGDDDSLPKGLKERLEAELGMLKQQLGTKLGILTVVDGETVRVGVPGVRVEYSIGVGKCGIELAVIAEDGRRFKGAFGLDTADMLLSQLQRARDYCRARAIFRSGPEEEVPIQGVLLEPTGGE